MFFFQSDGHRLKKIIFRRRYAEESAGVSLKDYLDFFHLLSNINDVDTALTFYHIAGASIDPGNKKKLFFSSLTALIDPIARSHAEARRQNGGPRRPQRPRRRRRLHHLRRER